MANFDIVYEDRQGNTQRIPTDDRDYLIRRARKARAAMNEAGKNVDVDHHDTTSVHYHQVAGDWQYEYDLICKCLGIVTRGDVDRILGE